MRCNCQPVNKEHTNRKQPRKRTRPTCNRPPIFSPSFSEPTQNSSRSVQRSAGKRNEKKDTAASEVLAASARYLTLGYHFPQVPTAPWTAPHGAWQTLSRTLSRSLPRFQCCIVHSPLCRQRVLAAGPRRNLVDHTRPARRRGPSHSM